jgi:predicted Rdx family selenoprotein
MITEIEEFKQLIKDTYPETIDVQDEILAIPFESFALTLGFAHGDTENVIFRAKIVELSALERAKEFAKDALKGNFFWSGTNGATLSIGADDAVYITERRLIAAFPNSEALQQAVEEFVETVSDWMIRSQLYA